ncbi:ABC transporter ATP-binding protein [Anaerosporobacter sp.]
MVKENRKENVKEKDCVMEVKDMRKSYNTREVLKGISFRVQKGDVIGLLGPNGAGKSTLVKIIAGIEKADQGMVLCHGENIVKDSINFKKSLGVVPQDIALYEDLSAYENVKFFGSLYGYKGGELRKRMEEVLTFVGLWDRRKECTSKFSGGMKRRLNIACSVVHSPEILIMDEPTVGIDPQSRKYIMQLIRTLQERGTTVIYISHYIEEIEELCNRVIIMDYGQILVDDEKDIVKNKYHNKAGESLESIFLTLTGTDLRDGVE